jgi:hypothetical protein
MGKGEFKFKNTDNLTTELIKDFPVHMKINGQLILVGTLTHADNDYVYGVFNHNGEENIAVEFNPEYAFSIEVAED